MIRRLQPKRVAKPWGVESLAPLFPDPEPGERIGEVWFEEAGHPLLIKFLFTSEKLSVQVHPDDAYAAKKQAEPGTAARAKTQPKTEMWHILGAEKGAGIAAGFQHTISGEELRNSAESGAIEQLLEWHEARPGDTFFIPSGTVHAIGAGLVLCEIQQNSNTTYRLYDYGRGRELHLDDGEAVSKLGPHAARSVEQAGEFGSVLVKCPYFVTERIQVDGALTLPGDGNQTVIVLEGEGEITGETTKAGEVWRSDEDVQVSGNLTLLRVTVPPPEKQSTK